MSVQAELSVRILMRLYIEFDQHLGWAIEKKVSQAFSHAKVSEGRVQDALSILKRLKMLDEQEKDGQRQIKLSPYGVQWLEKNCPLASRSPEYEFALPTFRTLKLVGPDEFFGRNKESRALLSSAINWTKWGAILTAVGIIVAIAIAVCS
jgi:hypothetical protein